jgi:hypothetical protein
MRIAHHAGAFPVSRVALGFAFRDASSGLLNNHLADPLDVSATFGPLLGQDCDSRVPDPGKPGEPICRCDGRLDVYDSLQPSVSRRRRDRMYRAETSAGSQTSPTLRLFIGYNSDRRRSDVEQIGSGAIHDPCGYRVNLVLFRLEAGWQ